MACSTRNPTRTKKAAGFTLIEVLITVAIVGVLAAIALPSYSSYIKKSRSKGAAADLVALSVAMENLFQKSLVYPEYGSQIIPATDRTGLSNFTAWYAAQSSYFVYSVTSSTSTYTLTASPLDASVVNCTLTLGSNNSRTVSGSDCGFTAW